MVSPTTIVVPQAITCNDALVFVKWCASVFLVFYITISKRKNVFVCMYIKFTLRRDLTLTYHPGKMHGFSWIRKRLKSTQAKHMKKYRT